MFVNWFLAIPWLLLIGGITYGVLQTPDRKRLMREVLRSASTRDEAEVDEAPNNS